jgi:hypothetical protein
VNTGICVLKETCINDATIRADCEWTGLSSWSKRKWSVCWVRVTYMEVDFGLRSNARRAGRGEIINFGPCRLLGGGGGDLTAHALFNCRYSIRIFPARSCAVQCACNLHAHSSPRGLAGRTMHSIDTGVSRSFQSPHHFRHQSALLD